MEIDLYIKPSSLIVDGKDKVPMLIHRLLLYDQDFPQKMIEYLRNFRIHNPEFIHVLWREADLFAIMNDQEISVYNSYTKNIQKSDYGRYIVLKYYGGIYMDFDIKMIKPLKSFYLENKNDDLFFEEFTLKEVSNKRNETPILLRIANYIMMHQPFSKHIQGILDICAERNLLPVYEEHDILYTTGPDVLTTWVDRNKEVKVISKMDYSRYLIHLHSGHWRFLLGNRKCKYTCFQ